MTYREFIRSGLPPAPETPALRQLRMVTAATCLAGAVLLFGARAMGNKPVALALVAAIVALAGLISLVLLVHRKVRHDLDYWTPARVAFHNHVAHTPPPDRPIEVQ
jgi:membrane protein YdbS with pleckstrin-like domain